MATQSEGEFRLRAFNLRESLFLANLRGAVKLASVEVARELPHLAF
jgi:hypothetical protein